MIMRNLLISISFVAMKAQIRILSPLSLEQDSLFDKGIIYGTTAIFGAPEYGRRTLGELVYYPPHKEHCDASDLEQYPSRGDSSGPDDMKIFILDRGGCPFEKKVRLAQNRGADAVIVVDFPCSRQREIAIKDGHPDTACRDSEGVQRIVMADTSGARDIHIPSILIPREQGERLIQAVTAYQSGIGGGETGESSSTDNQVVVMLLWDIPRADFVSVDLWMSSAATDTSYFMSQFQSYAKQLGPLIQFTPRFSIKKSRSNSEMYRSAKCMQDPTSSGSYYCDSQLSSLGDSVVREDLRQLCIWHTTSQTEINSRTGKEVTYSVKYWDYMGKFYEACHPSMNSELGDLTTDCADKVMADVGIDTVSVDWCMSNLKPPKCRGSESAGPECASSFNLLDDQAAHQGWSAHALRINGWRYSGPLEASVVLKTICQGFSSVPSICYDIHVIGHHDFRGISVGMAWFLVICMLVTVGISFWFYRRNLTKSLRSLMREEVMLEVRSQMADYAMLAAGDEEGGSKFYELTRINPQQDQRIPPKE